MNICNALWDLYQILLNLPKPYIYADTTRHIYPKEKLYRFKKKILKFNHKNLNPETYNKQKRKKQKTEELNYEIQKINSFSINGMPCIHSLW